MTFAICEWDLGGILAWRERVGVLIIVDVLSFSTAVDVATSRGAVVLPFAHGDRGAAEAAARAANAILATPRRASGGQFTLSPASLTRIGPGTRLMLPSPNGSRLSLSGGATSVLAGCLRNASAVGRAATKIAGDRPIAVIPAGERWPDGALRPAIEDLLGAGAILNALDRPLSAEAQVARDIFRSAGSDAANLVRGSISGRELIDAGFAGDVDIALEIDRSGTVPELQEGAYAARNTKSTWTSS